MIRSQNRLRLCACLIAAVLIFIWGNSLLPAELSRAFSDWVKELLSRLFPGELSEMEGGSGLLRKVAHFTEFAALGFLLGWRGGMLRWQKQVPFLWGVAAACLDEGIQRFVPGRSGQITDVLLDSCGVLTGLILLYLGYTIMKKYANNMEDKK